MPNDRDAFAALEQAGRDLRDGMFRQARYWCRVAVDRAQFAGDEAYRVWIEDNAAQLLASVSQAEDR